jgi:hypothetical protein
VGVSVGSIMTAIFLIQGNPLPGAMICEMLEGRQFGTTRLRRGAPVRRVLAGEPCPGVIPKDTVVPDMGGLETIRYNSRDAAGGFAGRDERHRELWLLGARFQDGSRGCASETLHPGSSVRCLAELLNRAKSPS